MDITYNVFVECPRCKSKSVYIGEWAMCFLCDWKRKKR